MVLSSPLLTLSGTEDRAQCTAGVQHQLGYAGLGESKRRNLGERILRLSISFGGPSFQFFPESPL